MQIKKIELKNFRQFQRACLEFAQGEKGKNVTIIIGENGAGKTTFAQAFFWCLYGEAVFNDKVMLNRLVSDQMQPGDRNEARVTLVLKHGEVEYTIDRTQTYRKSGKNVIPDNTVIKVSHKDKQGISYDTKSSRIESEIEKILPREISSYFFFDGERIEKMSRDITSGRKSAEFAEAVNSLLGLKGIQEALNHLRPKSKNSVIGSYEASFDASGNEKITNLNKKIDDCDLELEKQLKYKEIYENEIASARREKENSSQEIRQHSDGVQLQKNKDLLLERIKNAEKFRANYYKEICGKFNNSMSPFLSLCLIERSLKLLTNEDISGKDIPYIHEQTINYLIRQGVCICGTHLDEGSEPYLKLKGLINFLPPQSIGTSVSDFKKESQKRLSDEDSQNLVTEIRDIYQQIADINSNIDEYNEDIQDIDTKLSGNNISERVRFAQRRIQTCDKKERDNIKLLETCVKEIGKLESERERADTERRNLALRDKNNKVIELCIMYAKRLYNDLYQEYEEQEKITRNNLQNTINEIFNDIYNGDLSLVIDDQYHISVYASNSEGEVETSTAQNISVIFAFILGIIKLAKESQQSRNEADRILDAEPYPLVMDAPLSTFDKRRIQSVCQTLPKTADQVIIFIKDTDGEIAEAYLREHIVKTHFFVKKNEFLTEIK